MGEEKASKLLVSYFSHNIETVWSYEWGGGKDRLDKIILWWFSHIERKDNRIAEGYIWGNDLLVIQWITTRKMS